MEIVKICWEWLKYLMNGLINLEMAQRFGTQLKYLGKGLDISGTA